MLDKGAGINAYTRGFSCLLEEACNLGNEEIVQLLLDNCAAVSPEILLKALPTALREEKVVLLQMLFDHGGDLNQKDIQGQTVCHHATARGYLSALVWLASRGLDLTVTDKQGRNCLHLVPHGFVHPKLLAMLLEYGLDPNSVDSNGWTPLHWAAKRGDAARIAMLEDAGAIFSMASINGWTPDDVATFHGHKINWKPTVTAVCQVAQGPEHKARCSGCNQVRQPPNRMALRYPTNLVHMWDPIQVFGLYGLRLLLRLQAVIGNHPSGTPIHHESNSSQGLVPPL